MGKGWLIDFDPERRGLSVFTIYLKGITMIQESVLISLTPVEKKAEELEALLVKGAELVQETEPKTILWFGFKGDDGEYAIFDCFADKEGKQAHFDGLVAAALKQEAGALVAGGWQSGVLERVQEFRVLSHVMRRNVRESTCANVIMFTAQEGKARQLESLLTGASDVVNQTEPGTLFWVALKLEENTFAIVDAFATHHDQEAHFNGKVAGALQAQAEDLVVQGWQGVLDGVQSFTVVGVSLHQ